MTATGLEPTTTYFINEHSTSDRCVDQWTFHILTGVLLNLQDSDRFDTGLLTVKDVSLNFIAVILPLLA